MKNLFKVILALVAIVFVAFAGVTAIAYFGNKDACISIDKKSRTPVGGMPECQVKK